MTLEVGKKYTDGSSIVEIKFIDYESCAWGLDQRLRPRFIATSNVYSWQEVSDKPDPGEGWRLLEPDEEVEEGDEYYSPTNNGWSKSAKSRYGGKQGNFTYRRRTAPHYVPYTWEDREELRGKWFRRKVKDTYEYERLAWRFDLVDGYFYVGSTRSDELLNEWVWIDGSPCGKAAV